jgi:hypothetical protein
LDKINQFVKSIPYDKAPAANIYDHQHSKLKIKKQELQHVSTQPQNIAFEGPDHMIPKIGMKVKVILQDGDESFEVLETIETKNDFVFRGRRLNAN